jgi:hypothetical protein
MKLCPIAFIAEFTQLFGDFVDFSHVMAVL